MFAPPCARSVVLVACDLTVSFVFLLFLAFFSFNFRRHPPLFPMSLSPRVTRSSLRHLSPDFDWNLLEQQSSHFTATEDHAPSTADSKGKEKKRTRKTRRKRKELILKLGRQFPHLPLCNSHRICHLPSTIKQERPQARETK